VLPVVLIAGIAHAATLDATFGTGGQVVGPPPPSSVDQPVEVVVEPGTGRLFVATVLGRMVAHLADGSLDTTFGTAGIVTAVTGPRALSLMVRQPSDGSLVVVGSEIASPGPHAAGTVVRRFDASGALDATFGTSGEATSVQPEGPLTALLQPDGKLLVGGRSGLGAPGYPAALARFLPDGTLDPGFGSGGVVVTGTGDAPGNVIPRALLVVAGGKIVVASRMNSAFVLSRYDADGTLDTSFGTSGFAIAPVEFISGGRPQALFLEPGDKILAVANAAPAAVRFLADGTLDTTYGTGGYADVSARGLMAAVRDGDGVVVTTGGSLFRITADGSLDTAFAPCAYNLSNLFITALDGFPNTPEARVGLARQPSDGRLVVAAPLLPESSYHLERYVPGSPLCQPATSGRSRLNIRPGNPSKGPAVKWTWEGSPVPTSDFGDPAAYHGDDYVVCLLQPADPSFSGLFLRGNLAPSCTLPSCWKPTRTGYRRAGSVGIKLASSAGPRPGKIKVKAVTAVTDLFANPPYALPITMRIERDRTPFCWEAQFSVPTRNEARGFVARSD
jgi:uncharacterized delta-60 repeat protein